MNTDLSVDAVKGILAAAPVKVEQASTETQGNAFADAMANGNPELGSEGGEAGADVSAAQQLINDYRAATGFGSK